MTRDTRLVKFCHFIVLYSVIILTCLRAHVIPGNTTGQDDFHDGQELAGDLQNGYGILEGANNPLDFLDGFVIEDDAPGFSTIEHWNEHSPTVPDSWSSEGRKISKRSASSTPVPRYMEDMYQYLAEKRFRVRFDTARSFQSTGSKLQDLPLSKLRAGSRWRQLTFNVSSFPVGETVEFAQLRIQVQPRVLEEKIDGLVKIRLYFLIDGRTVSISHRDEEFLSRNSLLAFDLTNFFREFVESGTGGELRLEAELSPPDLDDCLAWDAGDHREIPQLLILSRSSFPSSEEDSFMKRMKRSLLFQRPLQKGYSATSGNGSQDLNHALNRTKRSEEDDEEAEEQSNFIVEELGRIRKGKLKKKKNPCKRKPLQVSFADINYDQWIIAPPSYEAFECSGKCSFPMSAHLTPTKHAIIQTLMHSLEPKQISRACCVPTQLGSISVLYIDDDGVVTYKYDYEDMVVMECGCR